MTLDVATIEAPAEPVEFVEVAIEAAERHGRDSDPDHEVGDLQALARLIWKHLPASGRAAVTVEALEWGLWNVEDAGAPRIG